MFNAIFTLSEKPDVGFGRHIQTFTHEIAAMYLTANDVRLHQNCCRFPMDSDLVLCSRGKKNQKNVSLCIVLEHVLLKLWQTVKGYGRFTLMKGISISTDNVKKDI